MNKKAIRDFLAGLDEQELTVLQIAALLGDQFQLDYLLELNTIKASRLLRLLRRLVKQNIIREKSGSNEDGYSFVKKNLADAVLNTLEDEKREILLSGVISHLAKELPAGDMKPLILAKLYLKGGKKDRGFLQYTKEAADLLASAHRKYEALDLYEEIIESLDGVENDESLETAMYIDSVLSYAPIAINLRPPDQLLPILEKAKSASEKIRNVRALATLELCLGRLSQKQGDSVRASRHYNKGWDFAQGLGDDTLLRTASKLSALALFWQGRMIEAIQLYENTLGDVEDMSAHIGDLWAHLMLAYCYGLTGRIARGLGMAEALRERASVGGNLKAQAFSEAVIALILLEIRHVEKAVPHIDNALQIGKKLGDDLVLWMAKPCKAYDEYSRGNSESAQELMASAINHAQKIGQMHHPSPWIIEILWSWHKEGLNPIEGYSFQSETDRLMEWPDIYMKGAALRYYALDKRLSGSDLGLTEEILRESEKLLQEAGAEIELGRTQVEFARLLLKKKDSKRAERVANKAFRTFSKIDRALFPSELLSMIHDRPKENRIFQGLEAVSRLSSETNFHPGYKTYLGKVVALLSDMFGAERSAIFLTQDERLDSTFNIAATRNFSTRDLDQLMKSPVRDLMMRTMEKREPLVLADTEESMDIFQGSTSDFPIRSIACVPLLASGRVIGLLYADNRLLKGVFSEKDTLIMTAIATQVALFMKTMTLSRELEDFRGGYEDNFSGSDHGESLEGFHQIIGKSKAIRNSLARAKKVSGTDATVLIIGETGVGKELLAQAIHQQSSRSDKPFITVNISALTENLLASELFGHEKGAFTSAERTKIGRFEMANHGTIFLDEIGDLTMEGQVKLLRVLQEGEFERVGGTHTIRSDFRLIAATNRNLVQMIAKGDFRPDLFYRVNTFPIEIRPLRERKEDIPHLALYFLRKYAKKHRKENMTIPNGEMKKLLAYSWPGNIRELEHIIERALILSEHSTLSIPDIKETYPVVMHQDSGSSDELLTLDELQRRHITRVLEHVKWRLRGEKGAAMILGLKPSTLEFRMKKLGIKR